MPSLPPAGRDLLRRGGRSAEGRRPARLPVDRRRGAVECHRPDPRSLDRRRRAVEYRGDRTRGDTACAAGRAFRRAGGAAGHAAGHTGRAAGGAARCARRRADARGARGDLLALFGGGRAADGEHGGDGQTAGHHSSPSAVCVHVRRFPLKQSNWRFCRTEVPTDVARPANGRWHQRILPRGGIAAPATDRKTIGWRRKYYRTDAKINVRKAPTPA